jgi:hypothetical protein
MSSLIMPVIEAELVLAHLVANTNDQAFHDPLLSP